MLIWMCALHCEAKPVIDFYHLEKANEKSAFDFYSNQEVICVVSGIGLQKMTEASNWAETRFRQKEKHYWINIGIAGNKYLATGTTVVASQITLVNQDISLPTAPPKNHIFIERTIISLTEEKTDYDETALFDMEAYAFMLNVIKFTTLEHIQIIKVISDNKDVPPDRNKKRISNLIANNMKAITQFAFQLQLEP